MDDSSVFAVKDGARPGCYASMEEALRANPSKTRKSVRAFASFKEARKFLWPDRCILSSDDSEDEDESSSSCDDENVKYRTDGDAISPQLSSDTIDVVPAKTEIKSTKVRAPPPLPELPPERRKSSVAGRALFRNSFGASSLSPPPVPSLAKTFSAAARRHSSLSKKKRDKTGRQRGSAVEAFFGVTEGPRPGMYRSREEALRANPNCEVLTFRSFREARRSILGSMGIDEEDVHEDDEDADDETTSKNATPPTPELRRLASGALADDEDADDERTRTRPPPDRPPPLKPTASGYQGDDESETPVVKRSSRGLSFTDLLRRPFGGASSSKSLKKDAVASAPQKRSSQLQKRRRGRPPVAGGERPKKCLEYAAFAAERALMGLEHDAKASAKQHLVNHVSFAISQCVKLNARLEQQRRKRESSRVSAISPDTPSLPTRCGQVAESALGLGADLDFKEVVFRTFDCPTGKVYVEEHMPSMFAKLRAFFGISDEEPEPFSRSMVGLGGGSEGEGKSKMLFFRSHDKRFVCKTVKKSELEYFRRIGEGLYYHYIQNPQTLICRFYGLYRITIPGFAPHRHESHVVVVMNNCLNSPLFGCKPTAVFDLKGSTKNRRTPQRAFANGAVGKDLNFEKETICIGPKMRARLLQLADIDVFFLRKHNIMDYSLLLGVYLKRPESLMKIKRSKDDDDTDDDASFRRGLTCTKDPHIGYCMGIIDILQDYDLKKKAETFYKAKRDDSGGKGYSRSSVSAIPPGDYGLRFLKYLARKSE